MTAEERIARAAAELEKAEQRLEEALRAYDTALERLHAARRSGQKEEDGK